MKEMQPCASFSGLPLAPSPLCRAAKSGSPRQPASCSSRDISLKNLEFSFCRHGPKGISRLISSLHDLILAEKGKQALDNAAILICRGLAIQIDFLWLLFKL